MDVKEGLLKLLDRIDDKKLEKAFEAKSEKESEMILSWGMGKNNWDNYLKKANSFSARIMNLDTSNLEESIYSRSKDDITSFYFYRAFYILTMYPAERLYLFTSKLLKFQGLQ